MKKVILFLAAMTCLSAHASIKKSPESSRAKIAKICKKLYSEAEDSCRKELIQECWENDGERCDEASHDGDFAVGVQICATETELPFLVEKYNEKRGTSLDCSDPELYE